MAIKQFEKLKPGVKNNLTRLEKESGGIAARIGSAIDRVIPTPFAPDDGDAQLKFRAQQRVNRYVEKERKSKRH